MSDRIVPLIMCGGAGTRLWPLSRENRPKQFLSLFGERSTFQETILRVSDPDLFDRPIVVTGALYRDQVREQLAQIDSEADILLESARRDSGPAIAAGTIFAAQRKPQAVLLALAADHLVKDPAAFVSACRESLKVSTTGHIVTFGVKPERPATEYGYISLGAVIDGPVHVVRSFVEKPDLMAATQYVSGGYLWNSGNFMFRADVLLDEYRVVDADSVDAVTRAVDKAEHGNGVVNLDKEAFERAKSVSIDYAVMERTARAAVIPVSFGWSDVGSWRTVWELSDKDAQGNVEQGNALFENAHNCYVSSDNALIALEGVSDLVVVATHDAVLVSRQSDSSALKNMVSRLGATALHLTEGGNVDAPTSRAPRLIESNDRYQVQHILIEPGEQPYLHRGLSWPGHWIVVRGAATIDHNGSEATFSVGDSIHVPAGSAHLIKNFGSVPLELIGVQTKSPKLASNNYVCSCS